MFNKHNRPKQTPQQKLKEEENRKEESRRGQILKEKIYPLICEKTESIQDAEIFLQTLKYAIQQAGIRKQLNLIVKDLGLEEDLRANDESERYKALIEILNDETIAAATDLLESFDNLIKNNIQAELKNRKVAEINIKFVNDGTN